MSAKLYLEGGGDSKDSHSRCREGFRKLIEGSGFIGRLPRLVACGVRNSTFDDFKTGHATKPESDYVAMLIDSEEPMDDIEAAWQHLIRHDGWDKPAGASDEQVLFMTTCMETWIVADRKTLAEHFGSNLQKSALPALNNLERRPRQEVQKKLAHATRKCANVYTKGKRSFEVLGKLSPTELSKLPSFRRMVRILEKNL